ncbi:MAG: DNA mismatch repair endonuclease MutL [Clostridiales bacterium]|nr:DNA mismatch repair endonuclease MutL [Clostridiales bacterium]
MGKIHILGENISNKIAAGEVVERPASVVKELVENSIDAGANSITVEIKDGGTTFIRVSDNGSGMDMDDAKNSFIRHATSKINSEDDLSSIKTLGFRGEALASIAAVSHVDMQTKLKQETYGTRIEIHGGIYKFAGSTGCPDGTTITVRNLFFNTPARLKFLKKESREAALISDIVLKLSLSKPEITFKYINNKKLIFNTPGNNDLKSTILSLYGKEYHDSLIDVSYKGNILSIAGYIGRPESARSNRNFETFFVNNRYIQNRMLCAAVENAYKTYLPVNKFAFCILFISICPEFVDVNVHPTKAEVRFQDEREVFSAVFNTIRNGLAGEVIIPEFQEREMPQKFEQKKFYEDISSKETGKVNDIALERNEYSKVYRPVEEFKIEDGEKTDNAPEEVRDDGVRTESRNLIPPLIIIGQCNSTYILAQGPDGLYIIDQHAAHERVLFEKFKSSFERGGINSQKLLTPFVIELTPQEIEILKENMEIMKKIGFEVDFFGNNSVMLRAVPIVFGEPQLKKLFMEILDLANGGNTSAKSTIDNILYTMACRSAVKANDKLNNIEMEGLVKMLRQAANPYTCPHGRPTIIKITEKELEKKFKRIQ